MSLSLLATTAILLSFGSSATGAFNYRQDIYLIKPVFLHQIYARDRFLTLDSYNESATSGVSLPRTCKLPRDDTSPFPTRIRTRYCHLDSVDPNQQAQKWFPRNRYFDYVGDPRGSGVFVVAFTTPNGRALIAFDGTVENSQCSVYQTPNRSDDRSGSDDDLRPIPDFRNSAAALVNCSRAIMSLGESTVDEPTTVLDIDDQRRLLLQDSGRMERRGEEVDDVQDGSSDEANDERSYVVPVLRATTDDGAPSSTSEKSSERTDSHYIGNVLSALNLACGVLLLSLIVCAICGKYILARRRSDRRYRRSALKRSSRDTIKHNGFGDQGGGIGARVEDGLSLMPMAASTSFANDPLIFDSPIVAKPQPQPRSRIASTDSTYDNVEMIPRRVSDKKLSTSGALLLPERPSYRNGR